MKLCTFSPLPSGEPRPGLVVGDDKVIDIPAALGATDETRTMLGLIRAGAPMLAKLKALESTAGAATIDLADVKLHAPIPRTAKNVFAIGWNYLPHFEEGAKKLQDSRELPKYPVIFSKAPNAITGPYDTVPFHSQVSTQCDWEVELAMVLGPGGKDIAEADAMQHVFGYMVANDVSWRDIQRRHGGQWDKGKSLDGSAPMGPWIVTADSIDPNNLRVTCRVNGVTKQDSNTKYLYFKLPRIIAELSAGQTLEAGDVVITGTPEGVGFARTPPEFMKPGDLLETEIEGIGTLRNPIG